MITWSPEGNLEEGVRRFFDRSAQPFYERLKSGQHLRAVMAAIVFFPDNIVGNEDAIVGAARCRLIEPGVQARHSNGAVTTTLDLLQGAACKTASGAQPSR